MNGQRSSESKPGKGGPPIGLPSLFLPAYELRIRQPTHKIDWWYPLAVYTDDSVTVVKDHKCGDAMPFSAPNSTTPLGLHLHLQYPLFSHQMEQPAKYSLKGTEDGSATLSIAFVFLPIVSCQCKRTALETLFADFSRWIAQVGFRVNPGKSEVYRLQRLKDPVSGRRDAIWFGTRHKIPGLPVFTYLRHTIAGIGNNRKARDHCAHWIMFFSFFLVSETEWWFMHT